MADRQTKRDKVDFISSLSDEILHHILSFVPTEFAVRTSMLSPRWKHVWRGTPSLFFHGGTMRGAFINRVLSRYTAPKMTNLHLQTSKVFDITFINLLILFAMFRTVDKMHLQFPFHGAYEYGFPDFFYINSSLKQLSVQLFFTVSALNPRCAVSWTSLKMFSLRCCTISEESMRNILSGCPVLQSLSLHYCNGLVVLDLSNSPSLKTLEVNNHSWVRGPTQIVAPHLLRLKLIVSSDESCTIVDVSSLAEAQINIRNCSVDQILDTDTLQVMVLKMLKKLENVDKITFGENFLLILSVAEFRGVPFPMLKVKSLTLESEFSQSALHYGILRVLQHSSVSEYPQNLQDVLTPGIQRILQNSPDLKKLIIRTSNIELVPELSRNESVSVVLSTKRMTLRGW